MRNQFGWTYGPNKIILLNEVIFCRQTSKYVPAWIQSFNSCVGLREGVHKIFVGLGNYRLIDQISFELSAVAVVIELPHQVLNQKIFLFVRIRRLFLLKIAYGYSRSGPRKRCRRKDLQSLQYLRQLLFQPFLHKSEVRSQRSEVRDQRSEVRSQKSEISGQWSVVSGQKPDAKTRSHLRGELSI